MAHLMKSLPRDETLPVIWNVDNTVGEKGANLPEDVYLVQYMLKMFALSPASMQSTTRTKLAALTPTGTCDAYTIECIKYVQAALKPKNPTMLTDGRVSKATPSLYYGNAPYVIACINQVYRKSYFVNWPCISMDGDCSAVTDLVFRELYGRTNP